MSSQCPAVKESRYFKRVPISVLVNTVICSQKFEACGRTLDTRAPDSPEVKNAKDSNFVYAVRTPRQSVISGDFCGHHPRAVMSTTDG